MKDLSLRYSFNRRYIKNVVFTTWAIYFLCYCIILSKLWEWNFPIFLFFALIVASFNKYFYGYISYYFKQKYVDQKTLPLWLLYLGKILKFLGYLIWIYYFVLFLLCVNPLTGDNNFLMAIDANRFLIMIWLLILSFFVLILIYFYREYKMFPLRIYGAIFFLNLFVVLFSVTINNYIDIKNENPNIESQMIEDTWNTI